MLEVLLKCMSEVNLPVVLPFPCASVQPARAVSAGSAAEAAASSAGAAPASASQQGAGGAGPLATPLQAAGSLRSASAGGGAGASWANGAGGAGAAVPAATMAEFRRHLEARGLELVDCPGLGNNCGYYAFLHQVRAGAGEWGAPCGQASLVC